MEININTTDRKALVKALSDRLGVDATYMGPPTFAYKVGELTIERDSTVSTDDEALMEQAKAVLIDLGYLEPENETTDLQVRVPVDGLDGYGIRNLVFMLSSRQYLLNRVLGTDHFLVSQEVVDALKEEESGRASEVLATLSHHEDGLRGLAFADGNAIFTVPETSDPGKNIALASVFAMMVKASGEAKRVNPSNLIEENEKYYLRIWLLRLGFTGKGGQDTRRALLAGLKGHTAFRTPEEAERFKANQKAKRAAAKAAREASLTAGPEDKVGTDATLPVAGEASDEDEADPCDKP